jgi:drug/metabolite transporter (DMT)-like permease
MSGSHVPGAATTAIQDHVPEADVTRAQSHTLHYLVLAGGVLTAASSSIMIRGAQQLGMPSSLIAAGRMGIAALILLPIALLRARPEIKRLRPRDTLIGIGSGALLALHFSSWVLSLEYTSVASSVALVATNPLWIALASALLFREHMATLTWIGVAITVAGSALIGFSDGSGDGAANALLGDGLALLGALAASGYFLIGRELQRRLSTLTYVWLVYTSAAVFLAARVLLEGAGGAPEGGYASGLAGYPSIGYLLLLGLALGPQLLGHTAFNWSLRHLSATFVAVAILGEPIGSALLALLIFGQSFQAIQLVGFLVLLLGIGMAARGETRRGESNWTSNER